MKNTARLSKIPTRSTSSSLNSANIDVRKALLQANPATRSNHIISSTPDAKTPERMNRDDSRKKIILKSRQDSNTSSNKEDIENLSLELKEKVSHYFIIQFYFYFFKITISGVN